MRNEKLLELLRTLDSLMKVWSSYTERFEYLFLANDIDEDNCAYIFLFNGAKDI